MKFRELVQRNVPPARERPTAIALLAIAAFFVAVGLQAFAGAFVATCGQDACGHFISGVMIHDYIVAGRLGNPLRYLIHYHEHYPLVGIGHWPPLYYGIVASWMLLFSSSQTAVLLLSAAVAVVTALLLCGSVGRRQGTMAGLFVGLLYLASPLTQSETGTLMLDGPVTLACLSAMLCYASFMGTGRLRDAALFGVVASAGLLIKGNAGSLVLLPIFALLIGRRFDLPFKLGFWVPVPIVAILAGPWYYLTWGLTAQGFRNSLGLSYGTQAAFANATFLMQSVGPVIFVLAVVALVRVCGRIGGNARTKQSNLTVCAASLVIAVYIFLLIVPSAVTPRYVLSAVPPILILAAAEAGYWSEWLSRRYSGILRTEAEWRMAVLTILVISFATLAFRIPHLRDDGLTMAAQQIWQIRSPRNPVVLIASDANAESATIAGLAMQDKSRPSIFAIRGSRLLGGGGYNNSDYQPRFATASAVMAEIDRYKIPLVLYRDSGTQANWIHLRQIQEAKELFPNRWELVYVDHSRPWGIYLFRIKGNDHETIDPAVIAAISTPKGLSH
jgi:hypothetical protein